MLSINFVPFPLLETERLVLRRPEMKDVDLLFKYRSNREFMHFIPHRYATRRDEVEQSLQMIHDRINAGEGINWSITEKDSDAIIGMIGYVVFNKAHHRGEIGYLLFTPHQGKGFIHEASKAVIDFGFKMLNLHSIEAIVNHENMPSKRVLERLGFTKDAFFKDYLHHDGKFVSANVYSLVDE
ncbi:MAG TPA: GNAT family N-acetyltransferase [Flavipsychrobacter sp.]|nr:GNAT family N-acetyltransferase [Flavipsychrobacter sp.]